MDGETLNPEFGHIHVAKLPLTVFQVESRRLLFDLEATALKHLANNRSRRREVIGSQAAAIDFSIDANFSFCLFFLNN